MTHILHTSLVLYFWTSWRTSRTLLVNNTTLQCTSAYSTVHSTVLLVYIETIRTHVRSEIQWASNFTSVTPADLEILFTIIEKVYVLPKTTLAVSVPEPTDQYIPLLDADSITECETYPTVPDNEYHTSAAIVDTMTPVPKFPRNTLKSRTEKKIRATILDKGVLSPEPSRTTTVSHSKIKKPWQTKGKFDNTQRKLDCLAHGPPPRTDFPPSADPTYVTSVKGKVYTTPTKKPRLSVNTFRAAPVVTIASAHQSQSKTILDSGAGISGVGQSSKMTNLSKGPSVSVQGAFGNSIQTSIQGLLGDDQLHAVLVSGMIDDIYSLHSLLQPNNNTGAKEKVAIFTTNGALVFTAESCQGLLQQVLNTGHQTHAADQIDGIYIMRQNEQESMKYFRQPHSDTRVPITEQEFTDGLYTGYTKPGLN